MKRTLLFAVPLATLLLLLGVSPNSSAIELAGVTPLTPVTNTDGRAGLCYSFYPDGETERAYMALAHEAGSRWDRFDFVWPKLEPQDGQWDHGELEGYGTLVDELDAAGFSIVGILLWTPEWAGGSEVSAHSADGAPERPTGWYAPVPRSEEAVAPASFPSVWASPPRNLYESWDSGWRNDDGQPVNYWGRFVYHTVARYGDRVKHWEMWNEPEWSFFWTGTSADYAQLLKVGYEATKAACGDCQVLFGGLHYWIQRDYYKWVLNALKDHPEAAANNYFFDAMSIHLYSRSSNTYEIVNEIRSAMQARGMDHPIWITETGVPLWGEVEDGFHRSKYDYAADPEEAAAYVIQSYANAWAAGVDRYFFFRTHDADMPEGSGEYFGMIRNDRSLRPSYVAYQVATTHLVSPTMVTDRTYHDGVRRVTLWGTPAGKVSVLWNATPDTQPFAYPAVLPNARLIDRSGNEQAIQAEDVEGHKVYRVQLPGATANLVSEPDDYFIGGDPYLVIEEDAVPPSRAVVEGLDSKTISSTVTLECSATDDEAGVWGYEVHVQKDGGAWVRWGGIHAAPIAYTGGEHGSEYCFRVRAWDRAGNPGPWGDREPCTTLDWTRELRVDVGPVFGDENGDGKQGEGEPVLTDVSFRLVDRDSRDVVAEEVGSSWEGFTREVLLGEQYTLIITPADWPSLPPGWLPKHMPVQIEGYGATDIGGAIGLLVHRSSSFLPQIAVD